MTSRLTGSKMSLLWLRNNGATLISQVLNTLIFTFTAFYGWYDTESLIHIMLSSYLIFIVTSLLDTPVVYLGRLMKQKGMIRE